MIAWTETAGAARPSSAAGLADRVAEAAADCPDVLRLTAGPHGRIATYRAGLPLAGVAVRDRAIEVAVVVRYGRPGPRIAADVRERIRPLAAGREVNVLIADVDRR